jgi:ribosomal protein S26
MSSYKKSTFCVVCAVLICIIGGKIKETKKGDEYK